MILFLVRTIVGIALLLAGCTSQRAAPWHDEYCLKHKHEAACK